MNYQERLSDSQLAIFLFHGVVEKSDYRIRNYTRKHLEKDAFYSIMKRLAQTGCALSMDEVVAHHREGEPFPPRSFAITFDDGFENNYSVAAPILKDFQIPATFYVTTDFVENNTMSWVDRIELCLEETPKGKLQLSWQDEPVGFSDEQEQKRLLEDIRAHVKQDANLEVDALVSRVVEQCGREEVHQSIDPIDLKMTWRQVKALHQDPDFTVGGHTHRHAVLSFLDPDQLEQEIAVSLEYMRSRGGIQPNHYSYPEGLAHCYSEDVIKVLKRNGVTCCPTAIDGANSHLDDLFHLRRIFVI